MVVRREIDEIHFLITRTEKVTQLLGVFDIPRFNHHLHFHAEHIACHPRSLMQNIFDGHSDRCDQFAEFADAARPIADSHREFQQSTVGC